MTRSEAIQAMKKGSRVRHDLFSPEEWIEDNGNEFVFEDGCHCKYRHFWNDRTYNAWLNGWELVKTKSNPVKHSNYPASHKVDLAVCQKLVDKYNDKVRICVWPDGGWCHPEELEECLQHQSDDYFQISVNAGLDEDQIGNLVMNRNNPGQAVSHAEEHY